MSPFQTVLLALGDTETTISAKLREKNIRGRTCSSRYCPVANYLKACGFPHVSVGSGASYYNSETCTYPEETIRMSEGLSNWILSFDRQEYPEFIEGEP
jgi:hypothetical protein